MDLNQKVLYRFFKGNYSRQDYQKIKSLFADDSKRFELRNHLQNHWNDFVKQGIEEENVDHLLKQIHNKIKVEENIQKNNSFIAVFQKIAAILIIPIILTFVALQIFPSKKLISEDIAYAEIQCPLGVRTKFELPDGTTGFINSGSRLKYAVDFTNGRHVNLTGEAFFDVAHDENNPFNVQTSNLNIKVLGTQFNVIAYKDGESEEVILSKGKVEIFDLEGDERDILLPNQKLILNIEEGTKQTKFVEASQYSGWTEGKLIFRNETMLQVAERLGRWYNVDFKILDEELNKYTYRATFVDESLDEVIKLMSLTAPFSIEEQPREINNNIFQKRLFFVKLDKKRQSAFN